MSTVMEFLGISPMGSNGIPATVAEKEEAAFNAGKLVMEILRRDLRPTQIITRKSIENAIASVAATGGSTNAVLHLLAIAREAGVELTIDDFDVVSTRTPLIADLKPGGRFVASDLYKLFLPPAYEAMHQGIPDFYRPPQREKENPADVPVLTQADVESLHAPVDPLQEGFPVYVARATGRSELFVAGEYFGRAQ